MHWPWPVNGHPHQDAGCQRSHFKPRKSHIHPGAGWFWPKLGTRDGIHWASGFFLLSPPRPFWGYDRCRVSSPLQCVRPGSSPGQTMGHKKRRKARKKHKSQTRHGVENVKRKNNPVWARRHDEETQSQNGQAPPGFLASSGGLGAWGGGTDGTNGTYRLLLTMGLKMPCAAPRGALQWSLASTEKWIVHNLRGSALRDCHSSRPSPFLFLVEFVLGNIGSSGHKCKPRCRSIHHCFFLSATRDVQFSLLLFCSLRVLDAIDNDADDTSTSRVHLHLYLQ